VKWRPLISPWMMMALHESFMGLLVGFLVLTSLRKMTDHGVDGKIVGIRYYNGVATPGELVVLKREPQNQVR